MSKKFQLFLFVLLVVTTWLFIVAFAWSLYRLHFEIGKITDQAPTGIRGLYNVWENKTEFFFIFVILITGTLYAFVYLPLESIVSCIYRFVRKEKVHD